VELLPVIYWSLFSVGILTLVVLIFSFITFQYRKKYGNIPSGQVSEKERNKKVKVTNPDKKKTKDNKTSSEKKHHPKVQTRSRQEISSSSEKKDKTSNIKSVNLYKKSARDSKQKRIEVLNKNMEDEPIKEKTTQNKTKFHSLRVDSKQKR
jgi:hypothetical protein